MRIRQRQSAEYWKEVIEDFLKSSKNQKEYTEENKISRATLWSWSKQLGIPLNQRKRCSEIEKDSLLSFVEVQPIEKTQRPSSLKMEIIFPQGHTLKLEIEGRWEDAGTFIKTLVR